MTTNSTSSPKKDDSACVSLNKDKQLDGTATVSKTDAPEKDEIDVDALKYVLEDPESEKISDFIKQSLVPLLLAGIGLIGTGVLLHQWQHSLFYSSIHEALMLTPALLGLKGNLEMTFASRMSTISHMGELENCRKTLPIFGSNTALVQLQAIVVSLFATVITTVTDVVRCSKFEVGDTLLLAAAAVSGTCLSSAVLGAFILSLLMVSQRFNINPDTVVTPLIASFGDLLTFLFFIGSGTLQILLHNAGHKWVTILLLVLSGLLLPVWFYLAYSNPYTKPTLKFGWFALAFAAAISLGGGFILEIAIERHENLSMFQPLLAGLAGNRAAVQCSRLSSFYHFKYKKPGVLAAEDTFLRRLNPWNTYNCKDIHTRTAVILVATALPYQLLFFSVIVLIDGNHSLYNYKLIGFYMLAAQIQVMLLMYLTQLVVYVLWRIGTDPDHSAIPIMTSLSDLMGCSFVLAVFTILDTVDKKSIGGSEGVVSVARNYTCT